MSDKQKVGVVGLGQIGMPLATNLLNAGFGVVGCNPSGSAELEEKGGVWTVSPAEVAWQCDIVITVLPFEAALREVADGPNGLCAAEKEGLIVIELCTLPLAAKQWASDHLAEVGGVMLDCPISGYPAMVEAKQAIIFVSGDKEAADTCIPVLDGCSDKHVYLGEFGVGAKLKFVANLLVGVHMVASSNMLINRAPVMRDRDFDNVRAKVEIIHKDLNAISQFSRDLGATTPLLDASFSAYSQAFDAGLAKNDMAAIFNVLSGWSAPPASSDSSAIRTICARSTASITNLMRPVPIL